MARNELAVRAGRPCQPVAALRRPSSASSNATSSSARAGRPSGTGSPYGAYGGYGGQQYHHHQEPLLQRVGSNGSSAGGHRNPGHQGGFRLFFVGGQGNACIWREGSGGAGFAERAA